MDAIKDYNLKDIEGFLQSYVAGTNISKYQLWRNESPPAPFFDTSTPPFYTNSSH